MFCCSLFLFALFAQVEAMPAADLEEAGRPTLGGTQFWTDQLVYDGWRIQRNVKFGQHRLLSPKDRVAKSGTYADCRQHFTATKTAATNSGSDKPKSKTVLVTLHGLGRTRKAMSSIGQYVAEKGEFDWINFGYASTRTDIASHAKALRHVLQEFVALRVALRASDEVPGREIEAKPIEQIEFLFVAHSLGNIVVRRMLNDIQNESIQPSTKPNELPTPKPSWRLGRMVMLGPPNQGSAMATLLKKSSVFALLAGTSGKDLGAEWNKLQKSLATPACDFAIIAGGKSNGKGYNPLLSGDDDLVVRVEETKLADAKDFAVIPSIHTYLMDRKETHEMTLRFLQHGSLKASSDRP